MYGGHYSDTIFKDMWYFNLYTNMWQEFKLDLSGSFVEPPPLKDFVFANTKLGLIIHGGQTWTTTNKDVIDANVLRKGKFDVECGALAKELGTNKSITITIDDANTALWETLYIETN
jgi:hypothetical protein